jgi:hypothetical protein
VCELDLDEHGERPPVEHAEVRVEAHAPGEPPRLVASGRTDRLGLFGFATPSDVASDRLVVTVRADGFNARHLRLGGDALGVDLRAALYGAGPGAGGTASGA